VHKESVRTNPGLPPREAFRPRCLSIDLEVGIKDQRIHRFAAIRGDTGESLIFHGGDLGTALARLDAMTEGAAFLLGHNLIAFDLPHLAAVRPDLRLLQLPAIDTLRLNPLAFPRNPYHHLVKHYRNGPLQGDRVNDPELDARLSLALFQDQREALRQTQQCAPDLMLAWHGLTTTPSDRSGLTAFFASLRGTVRPSPTQIQAAIGRLLTGQACRCQAQTAIAEAEALGWNLAYALAWLSVAGGNSVMPPWVRHQFPGAGQLVRQLRDTSCDAPDCGWCRERHNATSELQRWFGFAQFRPQPAGADGRSLQEAIVEAAMGGGHVLGILPTGTGKSLCYQIPALSRYDKTGALTVVISPLVALMADQVANLEARGIGQCATLNGLLSMPERADVLDRVRLGDVAILIISPEQLRNHALRQVLAQREIGAWVLDEAHCLSKWGHDFRPDYRYVGRFIRERAGEEALPPVLCLTATAKPDVVTEIRQYFRDEMGVELAVFDGGAERSNLDFAVVETTPAGKFAHIHAVLETDLPQDHAGGAIIYCATRRQTEELATFLQQKGHTAAHFHSQVPPETKKDLQRRFIAGDLRVMVATNAFGMGIDKPDVRLVIHADLPGSLENYVQEAGRAGRDQQPARCVLLYTPEDVERQFSLSAHGRLSAREIQAVLKAIRTLDRKKRFQGEVVATVGEILAEEQEGDFGRDRATDDTRVRTALAWLEEAGLLTREENRVQVFPSALRVASLEEARDRIEKKVTIDAYRPQLLALAETLFHSDADEGISTDELMGIAGMNAAQLRAALCDLERLGIVSNDTPITAFVHASVEHASRRRFERAAALEAALIAELRQSAPDLAKGDTTSLHLRHLAQALKDAGHKDALPEKLTALLRGLAGDGQNENSAIGSLRLRRIDRENVALTLQRDWSALEKTAERRRAAAERLLDHWLATLPLGARGTDLLAETTLGKLTAALEADLVLKAEMKDVSKLLDRALLWLHEQEILRLGKGLAIFRPAMTIKLAPERRGFHQADFKPLKLHYEEQTLQIHVMAEYVRRALLALAEALRLVMDYFNLTQSEFLQRWLPDREQELARQTTPASWQAIVTALNSPAQQRIVTDDRDQANVLVLAGPGSGKTRVLVHRIAYLLRVRREHPHSILALAYNHHAAVQIRQRLRELVGDDAQGVMILTCHAFAMRLVGASLRERYKERDSDYFKQVLREALALLKGEGLPPEEADEQRDRLLAGFRWILVDEYQDIGPDEYELIAALAGRSLQDEERKLSLFAVGDDDQNIYAFNGAAVEFIRRFESDYQARPAYLLDNYRSTGHIIAAANALIRPAAQRLKAEHPITLDRARRRAPAGGDWESHDPIGQGRVQVLPAGGDSLTQAVVVMTELQRLAALAPGWNWATCAVIAREWRLLQPLRSFCEHHGIPVQMANEDGMPFWRLRETQALLDWLQADGRTLVDTQSVLDWLSRQPANPWWSLLIEAVQAHGLEIGGAELPTQHLIDWLADWGRQLRRRQTGLLLVSAHGAKGLEFDHVAVLDGGWDMEDDEEDADAARRLYYVAMTRARQTLTLARLDGKPHRFLDHLPEEMALRREPVLLPTPTPELAHRHEQLTLKDVDLGHAGRLPPDDAIHAALAALQPGAALSVDIQDGRMRLMDCQGRVVGRLAQGYRPPSGMDCRGARVAAILVRRAQDSDAGYRQRLKCTRWEVVIPELIFVPLKS
jgi:ATP-dependent DNA helicase RecQ